MINQWKKRRKKRKLKALVFSPKPGMSFSKIVKENMDVIESAMENNDQEIEKIEENMDGKSDGIDK